MPYVERIEVQGSTDVPLFAVTRSTHHAQLRTEFHAVVNGENGDVFLQNVNATFARPLSGTQGAASQRQPVRQAKLPHSRWPAKTGEFKIFYSSSLRHRRRRCRAWSASMQESLSRREKSISWKEWSCRATLALTPVVLARPIPSGVNSLSQGALGDKNHKTENDDSDPHNVLSDLKGQFSLGRV